MLQLQHCPSPAAPLLQVTLLDKAPQPQIFSLSCLSPEETSFLTHENKIYPWKKNRGRGKAGESNPRPSLLFEVILFFFFYTHLLAIWEIWNAGLSCSHLQSDARFPSIAALLPSPSAAPQIPEPFSQPRSLSLPSRLAHGGGSWASSGKNWSEGG